MIEKRFEYIITKEFNGYSIEQYLNYFHMSKEKYNSLIINKKIMINNASVKDKNEKIFINDILVIVFSFIKLIEYDIELNVIYEDMHIIVVDKPQGILIHNDGNTNCTLTNAVIKYLEKENQIPYAYPIHRIDYDTTGIVMFAKNPLMLSYLSVEIEKHAFKKEYACLCYGKFTKLNGIINKNISKDRHSNKQIVTKMGKNSISEYKVIINNKISKVFVRIIHGRKHQIRVHMKSINHPIVGDKIYGVKDQENLKLHFRKVVFYHPFLMKKLTIICEEKF